MPEKKVYITELETAILQEFIKRDQQDDKAIAQDLRALADKLEK